MFRTDEYLLSEIFLIASNVRATKKSLQVTIPYYEHPSTTSEVRLLMKSTDNPQWFPARCNINVNHN